MRDAELLNAQIIHLVQSKDIHEQADLQKMLQEKGYEIPQATLSRRLKKLKIAKVGNVYKLVEPQVRSTPLIVDIQVSDFGLIVLHTQPGQANSLAYYIDQMDAKILGTIAGDDTILVIVQNQEKVQEALSFIKQHFHSDS